MTLVFDPIKNKFVDDELGKSLGAKILYGSGYPGNSIGEPGDFYINTRDHTIHQKGDVWDSGVKIIGENGKDGAPGSVGPQGPRGADGSDGKDGKDGRNGVDGIDGVDGKDGADGKSVEIRNNNGTIEWRNSEADWSPLYRVPTISAISGGGTRKVGELRDVRVNNLAISDLLQFDGNNWVNITVSSILSGYVPYTGATSSVDLGTHSLTAQGLITTNEYVTTSTAANASVVVGSIRTSLAANANSAYFGRYIGGASGIAGTNNLIFGNNTIANGAALSNWFVQGNNAGGSLLNNPDGGALLGNGANTFGDAGLLVGIGNDVQVGNESVAVGVSAKAATREVSIGYLAGGSRTSSNTGGVFIGPYAGYLETADNKLYISNYLRNLITGDFSAAWVYFNGDIYTNILPNKVVATDSGSKLVDVPYQAFGNSPIGNTNSLVYRDSRGTFAANNFMGNLTSTATAAGTTILTDSSAQTQVFTGTSTQNCVLPDARNLQIGWEYTIINRSTGAVTVKDGGSATLLTLPASSAVTLKCLSTSTLAGSWDFSATSYGGTVTSFSSGNLSPLFTTSVATATTTPALSFTLSNAAANTWFGNATGGSTTPAFNSAGALTKTDDTNVTLALGGSPTTALLAATSLTLGWTGQLGLTRGGTNASLTASNGGIVYSTASAMAILSGTATARRMLQSGASGAPAWSTATWPAATTANQILYSSATNTVTGASSFTTNGSQVGIGGAIDASSSLYISRSATAGSGSLYQIQIGGALGATAANTLSGATYIYLYPNFGTNAGTISNAYGMLISSGAAAGTITNGFGLYIIGPGFGTSRYGLYVTAPSGGTNNYGGFIGGAVGLNRAPQAAVQVGVTATGQYGLYMDGTLATANSHHFALNLQTTSTPTSNSYNSYCALFQPTFTSGASGINSTFGMVISPTFTGSGTITQYSGIYIDVGSISGTTVTTSYGLNIAALAFGTTRYAMFAAAPTGGTTNYGAYLNGPSSFNTAPSVDTSLAVGGLGSASLHSLYVGGTISKTGTSLFMHRITGTIVPQSNSYNGYALYLDATYTCGASGINMVTGAAIYATISGSGTTNVFRGLYIDTSNASGVTVTTAYNLHIAALGLGTTRYSAYIEVPTGGSNNYCLRTTGGIGVGVDHTSGVTEVRVAGNVVLNTAGNGLLIKEGTNATLGSATLVAGTVTVNTTKVTASSRIMITANSSSGTEYGIVKVSARFAGTSFTITSYRGNNTTTVATGDTSTVAWQIIEPA